MKTLDEILSELVRKRIASVRGETDETITHYNQAKAAILALVPEKKDNKGRMYDVLHKGGYNECRDEILRRFEEGI